PELAGRIEIVPLSADGYRSGEAFDFVFCEGMLALAAVPDPTVLLGTVARHTAPGGVLVITCIDAVSDFSEVLRRFVAQWLVEPGEDLSAQVQRLLPGFSPHLSTLAGMNRRHDDWIVDNLLNPASIGPLLAIPDAIGALDGDFDVFGASPHFLTDWRWYKAIKGEGDRLNALGIESYWSQVHNLLDYRTTSPARNPHENRRLYEACSRIRDAVREFERTRDRAMLPAVLDGLETVTATIREFAPATASGVAELRQALARHGRDAGGLAAAAGSADAFAPWFGRGQQYLSFSRRAGGGGRRT